MRPSPRRLDPASKPLARVTGLGDLAAVLPYLIGFTPRESVTCIAMTGAGAGRSSRRVGLTARVDLPDVLADSGPLLLASVFDGVARTAATGVIVMVSSAEAVDPVVVDRLQDAADRVGVDLLDVGWDRGEVCVSLLCDDPRCCPPGGFVVDRASPAAVSATFAGVSVLPDREAVEAEFAVGAPDPALGPLIEACEAAAVRAIVEGDGGARTTEGAVRVVALAREYDTRPPGPAPALADPVVARCLADLADTGVRDAVWLAVDAGEVHGQGLWLELARRAPAPYDATPMFLLGWRSWRHGDGVRAVLAAERAAATPGGYSAARLLLDAINACVDPRTVPPLSA
ncbi:DUF4192 domain-containing protein [Jatrophihabitans sp. YIM 134969]